MDKKEAGHDRYIPRAADYLDGQSPLQRGEEKRARVLDWLYRWGFSSSEILRQVAGQKAKGYAKQLTRRGLLIETKTESGTPVFFYTLSKSGLEEVERKAMMLYAYPELDPYRVQQQQIRHYLIAQEATVSALTSGTISAFMTEREYNDGDETGKKRPDIVWIVSEEKIGIEVELSAKWERRLDDFITGIMRAIKSGDYQRFFIVSDSPAIIKRYAEAMRPGAKTRIWKKNARHHWEVSKEITIPEWVIESVSFNLLES